MQIVDLCAPVKVANSAENPIPQTVEFEEVSARRTLPGGTGITSIDLIKALQEYV
jgi:hypothetical protein